jgi:hypothetical protein
VIWSDGERHLAIGDVHGRLTALETLADFVGFADDDELIFLGDYVDRGPNSRGVIDWLITESSKQEIILLRGNHVTRHPPITTAIGAAECSRHTTRRQSLVSLRDPDGGRLGLPGGVAP